MCTGLQPGRAADQLAGMAARLLDQHVAWCVPTAAALKALLLLVEQRLQRAQPLGLDRFRHLVSADRPPACRAAALYLNE